MLVRVGDDGYDEQVIATAAKLAARKRRGIHVLVTITVPNSLPIDATDGRGRSRPPHSMIEQARVQGGGRVSGHWERVRAGPGGAADHRGGRRTCARPRRACALPRRVDGASLFGKTLETVLAERPCRVIIESAPRAAQPRRAVEQRRRAGGGAVSAAPTRILLAA